MKAIKPYLVLNMPAPATLKKTASRLFYHKYSTNIAQIMNPPSIIIYSKYFTQQLLFQLITVNPIELLPTCVFSKLNANELKNLNCICRDLVHQGHGSLVPFVICLC